MIKVSLPVKSGGLGLRRVASQASSALIVSAAGTRDIQNQILLCFAQMPDKVVESYQHPGCEINAKLVWDGLSATKQRSWNNPVVKKEYVILLQRQVDDYGKARLLAAASKQRRLAPCLDNNAVIGWRSTYVWALIFVNFTRAVVALKEASYQGIACVVILAKQRTSDSAQLPK